MLWGILAEVVLVLHGAFILFAVVGGLLALRWRWLVLLHVPCAVWAALVVTAGWICPLTPLEQWLRLRAGDEGYTGSFIEHYLILLIYPPGLTRTVQVLLGLGVVAINLGIYGWLWRRQVSRRHGS